MAPKKLSFHVLPLYVACMLACFLSAGHSCVKRPPPWALQIATVCPFDSKVSPASEHRRGHVCSRGYGYAWDTEACIRAPTPLCAGGHVCSRLIDVLATLPMLGSLKELLVKATTRVCTLAWCGLRAAQLIAQCDRTQWPRECVVLAGYSPGRAIMSDACQMHAR